ncbi:MAG: glycosyltransferase family 39 protein [Patescibacteria group bacterium]
MTLLKNIIKKNLPWLILFGVSLSVVFHEFLNIPSQTTFDEIEFAKLAQYLEKHPYTPYSFLATGHATLYFYLILASFKIFGLSLFALRLPSAIFGVLNPVVFYLIMKNVFGYLKSKKRLRPLQGKHVQDEKLLIRSLAFILAFIFITMRWYLNFARFGFEATFLLFLELMSFYFVLVFISQRKISNLIISGLFAGLAYNSYQPGRIFFLIPLYVLLSHIKTLTYPTLHKLHITSIFAYFFIPFLVLALPLTIYLQIHRDIRFYQQFYPDNHEMTLQEKGQFFVRNLKSTIGIFHIKGDVNGRHNYPNKPALNPILGTFFLGGLFLAIKRIKDKFNRIFILWFFLSLAPTLVTYPWENPNMLRTFTAIPSVVYFSGLFVFWLFGFIAKYNQSVQRFFTLIIVLLISISVIYEIRTYFIYQSEVFKEAFEAQHPLNYYLTH